jgi:hypothetical protein
MVQEDRAIAQSGYVVLGRRTIEQLAGLWFREGEGRLIADRSTSPTGLRATWSWRTGA